MKYPQIITGDEKVAVDRFLRQFRDEWGFAASFGLSDLLRGWQTFVSEVEAGYDLSLHDYTHSLALRDEIERLERNVPARIQAEIRTFVDPLDHRFRFATTTVLEPLLPDMNRPECFWWCRIPKILRGELFENLVADGVLGR